MRYSFESVMVQELHYGHGYLTSATIILDSVLRNSLYHLYGDASVNLFEQTMTTIGSKRSRNQINLKYIGGSLS